jgi:hypothetical protein
VVHRLVGIGLGDDANVLDEDRTGLRGTDGRLRILVGIRM